MLLLQNELMEIKYGALSSIFLAVDLCTCLSLMGPASLYSSTPSPYSRVPVFFVFLIALIVCVTRRYWLGVIVRLNYIIMCQHRSVK
jgi:hypothetical protein